MLPTRKRHNKFVVSFGTTDLHPGTVSRCPSEFFPLCIFIIYSIPFVQHRIILSVVSAMDSPTDKGIFRVFFKHDLQSLKSVVC